MIRERAMPTMTSVPKDLLLRLRDLARGQGGMAAVEFAVILPFMLTAYLGGIELGDGVAINRKVTITTRSVADLATRYPGAPGIADTDMSNILGASSTILAPYPSGPLAITVSQVKVDSKGAATITWSDTLNGTKRAVGSAVTLPGTLAAAAVNANGISTYYIWGEAAYDYTPQLGYVMTGTVKLTNTILMSPRESPCISRVPVYICQ
jgi:Flp pilus assembly protein TadG